MMDQNDQNDRFDRFDRFEPDFSLVLPLHPGVSGVIDGIDTAITKQDAGRT